MPRKLPPHVEANIVKGKTYLSFRLGKGPRIRLPDDPRSEEFWKAYQDALAGKILQARKTREVESKGTIGALIVSYKRSAPYVQLRQTTKMGYASRLDFLRRKHGHRTVAGLDQRRINTFFLDPLAAKPGASLSLLKMLRVLIRHAIGIGWLKYDPSAKIKRPKIGEIRSWTDDEIQQFENCWPIATKQRLAFALHLFTGQRRSDVHRMTWADIGGHKITVVQQKTGHRLVIPLHRDLRVALAAADRQHVTILNTEYGRPFTVDGYSQWLRAAITKAGLPLDCQPHGLRKAAGRRLANAQCSSHEIMAVLGHKSLAEAERYTREANQERLAASGMSKVEGQTPNRVTQTAPSKFGKVSKIKGETK